MALKGTAFIIMWHDITAEADAEYNRWHTQQHMPERLDHPGFLRSRRGINRKLERQTYFTCYEGETAASFESAEYQRSLNNPTEWTRHVAPEFRNFLRMACTVLYTGGRGVGGGLVTSRFTLPAGLGEADATARLLPVIKALEQHDLISAVHLAAARPSVSGAQTSETTLRPPMHEAAFDLVLFVETIGLPEAEAAAPAIRDAIMAAGFADQIVQPYAVAYTLERRDRQ